jgi:hypothetical protein
MRRLCLSVLVCLIGILPVAAHAEEELLTVNLPVLPRAEIMDRNRLSMAALPDYLSEGKYTTGAEALAIGAGIMIGAAAGYFLPFPTATVVGGLAGGIVSHWWYHREIDDYQPLPRRN